nr:carboxypeptidase-like regulatory domain-containing protein [Rufibacter quisquiliarum]
MTDADVVEWFAKQKGETCGRLNPYQLNRVLQVPIPTKRGWDWKRHAAILGLSAWVSTKAVAANELPAQPIEPLTQRDYEPSSFTGTSLKPKEGKGIKGVVVSADEKEAMTGVTVYLKGTNIQIATNAKGEFSFQLPEHIDLEKQVVIFSFIGYRPKEVKLKKLLMKNAPVTLELEVAYLGGIGIQWEKPKGNVLFLDKLKHFFS